MRLLTTISMAALAAGLFACAPKSAKAPTTAAAPAAVADDREVLPTDATPTEYDLTIEPEIDGRTFKGQATLHFDVATPTDRIVVNAKNLKIASAKLDGASDAKIELDDKLERAAFIFASPLAPGAHTLSVAYSGEINQQAVGMFASVFPTPAGEKTFAVTQFEPGDARRLAPLWDEPERKAVFNVSAIVKSGVNVVSNMPQKATSPTGDGKVRIDFQPTPKMSSYLLFLAAGDFDRISTTVDGVEIGVVTRAGEAEKGRYALEESGRILQAYNDYFGVKYPLPKLDQFAAPGAGGFGAMENWGAILYFEQLLLLDPKLSGAADKQDVFGVIAHEMAHQWFGDLVTMKWWDDIWLNEGYASWMATKITDKLHPEWRPWLQSLGSKEGAFAQDKLASSHPIVNHIKNVAQSSLAFDAITYLKGEAVIRMIEAYLGEDQFRDGIRAYVKAHAYGNTVTDDLWTMLEKTSNQPIRDIAKDFTTQAGIPLVVVEKIACEGGTASTVTLHQEHFAADVSGKDPKKTWRTPVTAFAAGNGAIARGVFSGPKPQTLSVQGCGAVKLNAQEAGYYRTKYADEAFAPLLAGFDKLDSADQLGLLNDAYALGRSGDAAFGRFLALVRQTPASADPVVLNTIAGRLAGLRNLFRDQPGEAAFNDFSRAWLKSAFARVGWDSRQGEATNETILRTALLGGLSFARDPDVIAEARKRFAAYLKSPASLSPELVETVVGIVGANADEKTFDQLLLLARGATNPRTQRLYLAALASVKDDALAPKAIAAIFDKKTSAQLAPYLFFGVVNAHPKLGWDYYRAHHSEIDPLLDPLAVLGYSARIASASTDATTADELVAYAKENLPQDAQAEVNRAAEGIRDAANVKQKHLPELTAWLEKNAHQ